MPPVGIFGRFMGFQRRPRKCRIKEHIVLAAGLYTHATCYVHSIKTRIRGNSVILSFWNRKNRRFDPIDYTCIHVRGKF